MSRAQSRALRSVVAIGLGLGCSVGEIDYEGKTCPCPSGYRCDDASNTCTKHGSGRGGSSGDGNGGSSRGGDTGESGDGSGGSSMGGAAGSATGGTGIAFGGSSSGKGGSGVGGTGVGGSGLGGGGKGGSGVGGSGKGGSATGGSATGGSATGGSPMGGTGGTGVPVICSGANTCGSLPNGGLGLVAVVFPAAPIIDCSKNCIGFLADIVPHTEGDVDGNLDVATGDICVSGRIGMDSLLDIQLRPTTWDAAAHATTGFEFSIEGSDVPGAMEFGYGYIRDSENPRCAVLTPASGHHAVRLDSVRLECSTGVDLGTTTLTELLDVHFIFQATATVETFDFCITGLAATR